MSSEQNKRNDVPGRVGSRDSVGDRVAGPSMGANSAYRFDFNVLTDDEAMDPLSGASVLNGIPVTVVPADACLSPLRRSDCESLRPTLRDRGTAAHRRRHQAAGTYRASRPAPSTLRQPPQRTFDSIRHVRERSGAQDRAPTRPDFRICSTSDVLGIIVAVVAVVLSPALSVTLGEIE